jgi:CBS-domain-containing membrane protein
MQIMNKPLADLTAQDLMTTEIVCVPVEMRLRAAAQLLLQHGISGAPVVNEHRRCVGLLTMSDFLRFALQPAATIKPLAPPLPITCSFQAKHHRPDGTEAIRCTLPPGVCPIQVTQTEADGKQLLICRQPRCVLMDWQMVELEKLPDDEVRQYMMANPVLVAPETSIRTLARQMLNANIHQVVIVNAEQRPIGIVSSTDLVAAVACIDLPSKGARGEG